MERTIKKLKEMCKKTEESFIENSILIHGAKLNGPVPDVKYDLEMIIELRKAVNILEGTNQPCQRDVVARSKVFYCWEEECNLPKCEKPCDVCRGSGLQSN